MSDQNRPPSAFVLTVSDRVSAGAATDESGLRLATRLETLGFVVTTMVVPDEREAIVAAVRDAVGRADLILTTGGTGLAPRDVTPQALAPLLDYEIPGLGELMRAEGRAKTPFAALSRSLAGVMAGTLVLALPGSPAGALDSLEAVVPLLDHALETLGGDSFQHPPVPEHGVQASERPS